MCRAESAFFGKLPLFEGNGRLHITWHPNINFKPLMRVWMGGSGVHYSLKVLPIIHLIKILGYSLKLDQLFIKSKRDGKEN